jgi:hypothetical protein
MQFFGHCEEAPELLNVHVRECVAAVRRRQPIRLGVDAARCESQHVHLRRSAMVRTAGRV